MARLLIVAAILVFACFPGQAADRGMYLCKSPVFANSFWGDLTGVGQAGVTIKPEIVASVARKNDCALVRGETLRPTRFVAGTFEITDGTAAGFATPDYYIIYANQPYQQRK